MLTTIDFICRRIIAYPLVIVGLCLLHVGHWGIVAGAWLTDNEDLIKEEG